MSFKAYTLTKCMCGSYLAQQQKIHAARVSVNVWDKYHTEELTHASGSNMIRCTLFHTPSMKRYKMPVNTLNFYNH
jgi:hypothetical protein